MPIVALGFAFKDHSSYRPATGLSELVFAFTLTVIFLAILWYL